MRGFDRNALDLARIGLSKRSTNSRASLHVHQSCTFYCQVKQILLKL